MGEETKVKIELVLKLQTISTDRDFLLSVINYAQNIEDRKTVIKFIDDGKDVTYENVILLALTLYEEREQESTMQ